MYPVDVCRALGGLTGFGCTPRPTVMKLKSFFKALIWRMSLMSSPNYMVCLPFVQVSYREIPALVRCWIVQT